jgi:hypothetical protein
MEYYQSYKGFGITYQSWNGKTYVDDSFNTLKIFKGFREKIGIEKAKEFIDKLISSAEYGN